MTDVKSQIVRAKTVPELLELLRRYKASVEQPDPDVLALANEKRLALSQAESWESERAHYRRKK